MYFRFLTICFYNKKYYVRKLMKRLRCFFFKFKYLYPLQKNKIKKSKGIWFLLSHWTLFIETHSVMYVLSGLINITKRLNIWTNYLSATRLILITFTYRLPFTQTFHWFLKKLVNTYELGTRWYEFSTSFTSSYAVLGI